jgi:hypothetical protein
MEELPDDGNLRPQSIRCWKEVILRYLNRQSKAAGNRVARKEIEQKMDELAQ